MSRPVLAVLVVCLACWSAPGAAAERPNVVVILADDLGGADLTCYGSTFHRTPHLDRLAAGGLRFTSAYASCPVCSPTRAALLTGKVPPRLGITDWLPGRPDRLDQPLARPPLRQELALDEVTLAEALKKRGYATGHIGKWHLGGDGHGPLQQGFDSNIAGDHTGSPLSYFAPFRNKTRAIPGLEKAPAGEYLTDRYTAEAERFLDRHKDAPFFLYLAHNAVHTPLRAKADVVKKYPQKMTYGRQSNPVYAAMLESLDDSVGRVVRKLDELKLTDRTIVIFTSDNGGLATLEGPGTPATVNAPFREGKGWLYEGGLRVPLIVRWPGVMKPGTTSDVPVISHDLFPTLVRAAGGDPGTVDGVNLLPVLQGGAAPERDALYWHYPHYANQGGRPGGAIRAGGWKLVEFYEDGRRELFDLSKDVSENRNLAAERPEVVERLANRLAAWRKEVGAQMPTANPAYRPHPPAADGAITLPARHARVHGTQLRYEPLPHKNTLGYWTQVSDYATWELTLTAPGTYTVEVLQGCGTGHGGSSVEVTVGGQTLAFIVEDTGGFQNFKARAIGTVTLATAGRHTLAVRPKKKAGGAIMDIRQVVLRPVKAGG
ncbi:MAG: sulfatase-like hydrolase/transferase [Gemmataceae bacterium]